MNTQTYMASISALAIILYATTAVSAHAALIADAQVTEQNRTVLASVVTTLEEQLKLIQMIYIQKLEARVAYLESIT